MTTQPQSAGAATNQPSNTAAQMGTGTADVAVKDPLVGQQIGTESALSTYVGPYVTEMLGRGQALAGMGYQGYGGPLTAGPSAGQTAAFQGIAGLNVPTAQMGAFTPASFTDAGVAGKFMNPYLQQALQPQIDEARRQADIERVRAAGRLTQAGAFGGGRQAIMDAENQRNLLQNLAGITGTGYRDAFDKAAAQFNVEQGRQQTAQDAANVFGLAALQKQADLGAQERAIESEGVAADYAQFREERDFPYKQVQYMQSLLQGLPLKTQTYTYAQPSAVSQIGDVGGGIMDLYNTIFNT